MILRTKGPDHLPTGYEIVLYISMSDSDKVGVFYVESECPSLALLQFPSSQCSLRYPSGAQLLPLRLPRPLPLVVTGAGDWRGPASW